MKRREKGRGHVDYESRKCQNKICKWEGSILENLDTTEENKEVWVPDPTFFCLDKERDIFVGAVNIRHYLNEELLKTGGHIGDGIRPSERRKGYATAMLALALEECKKLGISKVI